MKPFAEACARNRGPILEVLRGVFAEVAGVLEIGSGTGQHAVYLAEHLPHLVWHTSDLADNHAGIRAWIDESQLTNVRAPLALDVAVADQWPAGPFDAVFTANTLHIVSWGNVEKLVTGAAGVLAAGGLLCTYGPFRFDGRHTAESNLRFDGWLRQRDPASGVRDFEAIDAVAERCGLAFADDHAMPANNRILVWRKTA